MLLVHPLLLVIDRVPQNELAVHPPTRHELQFGHGDHRRYHEVDFLFGKVLVLLLVGLGGVGYLLFL